MRIHGWIAGVALLLPMTSCQNGPRLAMSQFYQARGSAHLQAQEYDAAVADFTEAIRWGGCNADLYYNRGIANFARDSSPLATQDFDLALRCLPALDVFSVDISRILTMRGWVSLESGRTVAALTDGDSAVALDPASTFAHLVRGRARLDAGSPDLAVPDLKLVFARDTLPTMAEYYLALAYRRSGETALARNYFQELSRGDSRDLFVMKAKDELRSMNAAR
jgi:tetratricopeptide (TPR) repeat protein